MPNSKKILFVAIIYNLCPRTQLLLSLRLQGPLLLPVSIKFKLRSGPIFLIELNSSLECSFPLKFILNFLK